MEKVRSQVRQTDRWLEEALAQEVVLKSRWLSKRTGFHLKTIKNILIPEFRKFPEGYRQFECKTWGGPAQAHRLFGTQGAPEDLIRFWLGHANKSVTDEYSELNEDVAFRKKVAEQVEIGFEVSVQAPLPQTKVTPNCTQSELSARSA